MDFSGIYINQSFHKRDDIIYLDVQNVAGTNCYCDETAMDILRNRIKNFSAYDLHFLDSGNFHYMSRIWIEKITEPFTLLVLDNHTDLQPPAFGGLLSCGGWIAAALEEISFLKEVILIGPDESSYQSVDESLKQHIKFRSKEQMKRESEEELKKWISEISTEYPLYISVDKDILSETVIRTDWSQGELFPMELYNLLKYFSEKWIKAGNTILGMDVCGESEKGHPEMLEESNQINQKLIEIWLEIDGMDKKRYV